jgi:hypothetical protein
MANWRVARGLDKLLAQINDLAPGRSKASDGSIGDAAHRKRKSDHNPDSRGIVRARDFTHDSAHGADMHEIAEALRLSRDRRITYVIWNRRVFSATTKPWQWSPYTGSNPHVAHMHVSVVATSLADDTSDWEITMPLSNDDIKRISDATAAKVLGRSWSIQGRTLAGTVEAILNITRAGAPATALAELTELVERVLAEVSDDPVIDMAVPEADRATIARRVVERLTVEEAPAA